MFAGKRKQCNMFINKDEIPFGETSEDIKKRKDIIWSFYQAWKASNPTQQVYNHRLKDYINVRQISIDETARHASKRYLSTLAVLQLDAILACSKLIKVGKIESRANQQKFKAMLVMQYDCPGIGKVKLLVGIRHKSLLKIQYCITAMEVE